MYCPRCAKLNVGGAKFCRDCGTDLETVGLALDGKLVAPIKVGPASDDKSPDWPDWDAPNKGWEDKYNNPQTTEDWLRKQSAGMAFMARGGTALGAALLAGVVILTIFGVRAWPLIIWAITFGWLSWWGVAYLAEGLGAVMQSRNMLRRSELIGTDADSDLRGPMLFATGELRRLPDVTIDSEAPPPLSVTEHTTTRLNKRRRPV